SNTPQLGTLVLIKEDNAPPLQWPMGRIMELHPGADGLVRVVTVKTMRGVLKRPLTKIARYQSSASVRFIHPHKLNCSNNYVIISFFVISQLVIVIFF
ncbi:unnamed protein product, partial [Tenebrio molitor]